MNTPASPTTSSPEQRPNLRQRRALAAAAMAIVVPAALWLAWTKLVADLHTRAAAQLASRCPGATLTGTVRLDGLVHLAAGPIVVASPRLGAPPLLTIERVTVRPRLLALLKGDLEVASASLEGVRFVAGPRGEALGDLASACLSARAHATGHADAGLPRTVSLAFSRAFVTFGWSEDGPPVEAGPFSGSIIFDRGRVDAAARISFRAPGGGYGTADVRYGAGAARVEAKLRGFELHLLQEVLRPHLPFELTAGSLDLDIDAPGLTSASAGEARIQAAFRGLELRSDRLAPGPVGPLAVRLVGTAAWDLRAGSLAMYGARLDLGDGGGRVGVPLRIALSTRPEPYIDLEMGSGSFAWDAMLAALPPSLAPPAESPAVQGSLSVRLAISGPLRRPDAWRIDGDLDANALEVAPPSPGARDLSRPFTWERRLPDGGTRKVVVGPSNPAFVPIDTLPPHVVRAVLTSEDAGFYGHHGFDLTEIQDALAHSSQRRLRGASTITQQIAKNLFLSVERTYARKIREALTTVALETCLGKRRLLEIYLNVAEWGPGVFGIGEAAHHWFGKDARDLSPKEAAFLATVIPNPVRYEMYRRRGALTQNWEGRVRDLLTKLRAADVITEEQLRDAWGARLSFAGGA